VVVSGDDAAITTENNLTFVSVAFHRKISRTITTVSYRGFDPSFYSFEALFFSTSSVL
jgi:hypothetical protein